MAELAESARCMAFTSRNHHRDLVVLTSDKRPQPCSFHQDPVEAPTAAAVLEHWRERRIRQGTETCEGGAFPSASTRAWSTSGPRPPSR